MPDTVGNNAVGPLSHSSANTLLSCEQKYVYYKVEKVDRDPDYEKSDALAIGSAVHKILEDSNHEKPTSIRDELRKCELDEDIRLHPDHFNLVHAMVLKYLRLHRRMGLKVLAIEFKLESPWFLGFVDALMEDADGKWWIVDMKTSKTLYRPKLPGLRRDPQLNLYAGHRAMIAEMFDLDVKRFGGCRWRVITKSQAKKQGGETDETFVKRLLKTVKAYDIPVPVSELDSDPRMEVHQELYERTQELAAGKRKPIRNYGSCMAFFSPCEYWSRCHGGSCHSDAVIEMTEEK